MALLAPEALMVDGEAVPEALAELVPTDPPGVVLAGTTGLVPLVYWAGGTMTPLAELFKSQ